MPGFEKYFNEFCYIFVELSLLSSSLAPFLCFWHLHLSPCLCPLLPPATIDLSGHCPFASDHRASGPLVSPAPVSWLIADFSTFACVHYQLPWPLPMFQHPKSPVCVQFSYPGLCTCSSIFKHSSQAFVRAGLNLEPSLPFFCL